MSTLMEHLKTQFASHDELAALQKAYDEHMQTAVNKPGGNMLSSPGTADVMITVDYDNELQRLVYHQSPFLTYLENHGCVSSANTAKVGYRVKEQKTTSSFIAETEDIPRHDPSLYTDEIAKMNTLVYPIEISDLAMRGVDAIDLLEDEIRDGYLDMAQTKDIALLQGKKNDNGFDGVLNTITTHTDDLGGDLITKDDVDILAQELIDDGGNPSAILTTAAVGRQLNDILYPNTRIIDQVDLVFGSRVTAYHAPNGQTIPILVDPNIDTTEGEVFTFIDNNTLRVRELVPPSMVPLAKTKLSTSRVLFTFFTFYNRAEYRNGMLTGIGTPNKNTPDEQNNPEKRNIQVSVSDGEDPVQGANVSLIKDGTTVKTATTGSVGGCTLTNVEDGNYTIKVTKDGFNDYTDSVTTSVDNDELTIELTAA